MLTPNIILHLATFTPNPDGGFGLPSLFWGLPGVAKSAIIEAWAERCGMACKVLSPSEHGDGAFGVTPMPFSPPAGKGKTAAIDTLRIIYPRPGWVDELEEEEGAILFLDELNTPAAQHLFGPMLALLHARRIAGEKLPKHVRVFGACNPIECSAGGLELPLPLANRMGHFDWGMPEKKAWNSWIVGRATGNTEEKIDRAAEEARVLAAWPAAYAEAAALVSIYTDRNQNQWHAMPKAASGNAEYAWPSLRTWTLAAHALAGAKVHGMGAYADALIRGFVGQAAAEGFAAFRRTMDLPDPEKLLDGSLKWAHNQQRLDISYAVFATCAGLVCGDTDPVRKVRRATALWQLLGTAVKTDADLCYDAVQALVKADLDRGPNAALSTPILNAVHLVAFGTK